MQVLSKQVKKHSREVKTSDMKRVKKEGKEMVELCKKPLGMYPCAMALAHCQVDHTDPLRFFALRDGRIIVNPVIETARDFARDTEGCYSYPFRSEVSMKRWKTIKVSYTEIDQKGKKYEIKDVEITGIIARIFQHEIDHMDGLAIYF